MGTKSTTKQMQIFIKTQSGKTVTLEMEGPNDTIGNLKAKLRELDEVTNGEARLAMTGKELEDTKTLGDYGIQKHSTLEIHERLEGGFGGWIGSALNDAAIKAL